MRIPLDIVHLSILLFEHTAISLINLIHEYTIVMFVEVKVIYHLHINPKWFLLLNQNNQQLNHHL